MPRTDHTDAVNMRGSRFPIGFTLIELLIVVAIIAILAAIAVPNFLEAQTRSKVARVYADMRTYVTAIESYHVDNNKYIPCAYTNLGLPAAERNLYWYMWIKMSPTYQGGAGRYLTTPIAYMTSLPFDPFQTERYGYPVSYTWMCIQPTRKITKMSEINSSVGGFGPGPHSKGDEAPNTIYGERTMVWEMECFGPDLQPWLENGGVIYDATNGTISAGDIWYFDSVGFVGGPRK